MRRRDFSYEAEFDADEAEGLAELLETVPNDVGFATFARDLRNALDRIEEDDR